MTESDRAMKYAQKAKRIGERARRSCAQVKETSGSLRASLSIVDGRRIKRVKCSMERTWYMQRLEYG